MRAKIITLIAKIVGNQITGSELSEELFEILFQLLAGKISEKGWEEIKNVFRAGKSETERILSREKMIQANVPEAQVDFVIEEIRFLLSKIEITDELLVRCKYNHMELGSFLWETYCEGRKKGSVIECEKEIKNGLTAISKVWIGLKFDDPEFEKKCMARVEIKTDYIISLLENKQEKRNETVDENSGSRENSQAEQEPVDVSEWKASDGEENLPDEIKIYLAASQGEFQDDIDILKEFIEEQNDYQKAVRLTLQAYDGEGQKIQDCKYCYMLVGGGAEKWMQEMYGEIYKSNPSGARQDENIQLRLFFKNLSDEERADADGSRRELEDRYKKDYAQVPLYFSDINRIKLDILQKLRDKASNVKFSTKSIIQFQNNKDFEKACKECTLLQEQYEKARKAFNKDKSPETKKNRESLGEKLSAQNEVVEKMEKEIWDNLNLLTDKLQNRNGMDAREAQAIESVIEYGDYDRSDGLLRGGKWNREVADLEQAMKEQKEKVRQFISAQRTLISNLKTKKMSSSQEKRIIEIYEYITELSKKWQIEYVTLYEFAEFWLKRREYDKGIAVGENLKCLYGLSDCTSAEDKIRMLMLLGNLYYERKKYKNGKANYKAVFQIFQDGSCKNQELRAKAYNELSKLLWKTNQLAEAEKGLKNNIKSLEILVRQEPQIYEPVLAYAYNYMAILENRKNRLEEAEKRYHETLKIRRRLAVNSSSSNFQPEIDLTSTYSNLAYLYKKMGKYQEAERYYRKAIKIRERGEKQNPSAYRRALAFVYSNFSVLLNVRGDNEEAQKYCKKAYDIRREIKLTDSSYEVEFAYTLYEYGIILTDAGMYLQAKEYLEEAIIIREKWANEDKMTYRLYLAESYCRYGILLAQMGEFPPDKEYDRKAERNMQKACNLCDKHAIVNKGYDADRIAEIYQSFAKFLNERMKKYSEAEKYYEKAVEGLRYLTKQCRQVFEPKLKKAEEALEELQMYIRERL
ncbi:hypothetical protein IMSAGC009_03189 [Lachnospiraceae bacterium]|nr:hypothetical protein IMSAGC009_03189 [Lachnospiraceae bacterium]